VLIYTTQLTVEVVTGTKEVLERGSVLVLVTPASDEQVVAVAIVVITAS